MGSVRVLPSDLRYQYRTRRRRPPPQMGVTDRRPSVRPFTETKNWDRHDSELPSGRMTRRVWVGCSGVSCKGENGKLPVQSYRMSPLHIESSEEWERR